MCAQVAMDTPDGQLGVVNAQLQLATVAGGTRTCEVGIPPNAESLIVMAPSTTSVGSCFVQGVTTGLLYPGILQTPQPAFGEQQVWVFDVSSVTDAQVFVEFNVAPTEEWYVYADAGVHIVADTSKLTDLRGVTYAVPSVPNTAAGDHPPTELSSYVNNGVATGTVIIAAPGAGKRPRVFYASIAPETGGNTASLITTTGGVTVASIKATTGGQSQPVDYKPTGLPCPANAGLEVTTTGGAASVVVVYTTENI